MHSTVSIDPDVRLVRETLVALADPARAVVSQRFFKTAPGEYGAGDAFIGIAVPTLRAHVRRFEHLPLDVFVELLRDPVHEIRLFALLVMVRKYARGDNAQREAVFDQYVANISSINNWDLVDSSAEHIVGAHLQLRDRARLTQWAQSESVWLRRIAVIATFYYVRKGNFVSTFELARLLLNDPHDLIHKAVGWALREVGERDLAAERAFLDQHADAMPRTMLRYAIEHMDTEMRASYLARGNARPTRKKRTPFTTK